MPRVLFVCLGNICRSPTAEAVFRQRAQMRNFSVHNNPNPRRPDELYIDSCGTGDWHIGKAPDARALSAAQRRGYDMSSLRARQVNADDFFRFDFLLAMDNANLRDLEAMRPQGSTATVQLFLDFHPETKEVPDPYYGGADGFSHVLDLIEVASDRLLDTLSDCGAQQ
ncbi:MAG: low molecular weight phosphotyrosine protein phosphatase [Alcanivoracaceae bacterium]|nr:low molecular weight phosphotyrosine protein phosphatase [Alcanivoracaceae bacterium]